MEKMIELFAGLGGLAVTFEANPTGAVYVVVLAVLGVAGVCVWRGVDRHADRAVARHV